MIDVKTIIELDKEFSIEEKKELMKFIENYYNVYEHDINIINAENYHEESDFVYEIFDKLARNMADEDTCMTK